MRSLRPCLATLVTLTACSGGSEPGSPFITPDARVFADATLLPLDAGSLDSGVDVADAGSADTAQPMDSGPADTGAAQDAGLPVDAGELADSGSVAAPCSLDLGLNDRALFDALLLCLNDSGSTGPEQVLARDTFVQTVLSRGGFPIVHNGEVTFFYVRDPAFDAEDDKNTAEDYAAELRRTPIRVAGAFNAWDPDAGLVMSSAPQDVFHLTTPLDVASSDRWGYKLVAKDDGGTDTWFSDPLSRRFDYDGNGRISIVRGGTAQGHLELLRDVEATQLANQRDVYLYLPPAYETSTSTYAVLYMHDGNNLFSQAQPNSAPASWEADQVFETELSAGGMVPFMIVGVPNNADRRDEYTHVPDDTSSGMAGGSGDAYADFIVSDLKPLVDARYRTDPRRQSTGIMGSSLGGLISFYIGLLHPNTFRFVGGMSSTFDWGRFGLSNPDMVQTYQAVSSLPGRDQVYYLDSGGGPPTAGCSTAAGSGSDNYCSTARMRDALVAAGINTFPVDPDVVPLSPANINIMHWWTPDAPHNESAWQARLHRAFRLFSHR